jgi:hypothetical protein
MALSVDYNYKFALDLILKSQSAGLKSTAYANHWNDAQSTYFDDLLGRFQARGNGKEGANTGLIVSETILQKLSPFTKVVTLGVTNGVVNKPDDFAYRLSIRSGEAPCVKILPGSIGYVNSSVIDPPSTSSPSSISPSLYFSEYQNYYSVLPITLTSIQLEYIARPNDVLWGFTFDMDDRQVYNEGASIQPQWDNSSCREITKRMLTNLGVAFKDNDFVNFGKSVQLTGE